MGCQAQTDPRDVVPSGPGPDPDSPLIGTYWYWDSGWGESTLYFESAETMIWIAGTSGETILPYSYGKEIRTGQVDTLGDFSVTEDYTELHFPMWRQYPHGADFTRVYN